MLRSEDPELYLEKAVHRLCDYYGKALTLEYVRNKIAWALYQTWKEFDKKSEERRMSENLQPTCNQVATDLISRQAAIKAICEDGTWLESQGCTEITMAERKQRDADILGELPSAQPTLYGYNIEHLELIARVLQKEDLPPERVVEALTDIGRIVAIVNDELEEALRKAAEQCMIAIETVPSAERKGEKNE